MKAASWISALALALVALPGSARAEGGVFIPPFKVQGNFQFHVRLHLGNANLELAPWYLYYPAGAGQQPVGPSMHFPNWPMTAPGGAAPQTFAQPQPAVRPVGYNQAAPSYWYGQ